MRSSWLESHRSSPRWGETGGGGRSSNGGDALNLDHHLRPRETCDGDRGARRKILAEYFRAQLGHARGVARVDEKDRHGNKVGEFGAGAGERIFDIAKCLPALWTAPVWPASQMVLAAPSVTTAGE